MKILLDVDGCCVDFMGAVVEWVNTNTSHRTTYFEMVRDFQEFPFYKEHQDELEAHINKEGFCFNLKQIVGAKSFIDFIRNDLNHEVLFLTSPYHDHRTWAYERTEYLKKYFNASRNDIIFAKDKKYVSGHCLIDDLPKNLVDWSDQQRRESILMDQPWNQNEKDLKSKINPDFHYGSYVHRVYDFEEAKTKLKHLLGK